ncbi:MAG: cytochrome b/b6 domain-containing protein [Pseudomonadota bacterium]
MAAPPIAVESLMPAPHNTVKVWDGLVRLLHWLLVLSVALAWLSTLGFGWVRAHEPAGYAALAVVVTRVIWGFAGSRHARFAQFVRKPRAVRNYALQLKSGREPRYAGHNPLGGWMVVLLLAVVGALGITGWLYTTDYFWGTAWLDQLHGALAWVLLLLIAGHLGGVLVTSYRHRENLVGAMFTGRKQAAAPGDIED